MSAQLEGQQWRCIAPDGRVWTGESPLRVCAAAQRDTVDPVLAMQRIKAALDEQEAADEAMQRDAARYLWWRTFWFDADEAADFPEAIINAPTVEAMDAAIDQAIATAAQLVEGAAS